MKRKALCLTLIASAASPIAQPAAPPEPLRSPADTFTTETVPVKTSKGEVSVRYRAYRHIPYVADPIDEHFQSLDVRVPIAIDGAPVDAAHAPILLVIGVGGYLSSSNAPRSGPPRAGGRNADLAVGIPALPNLMNPMYFISRNNADMANHWWIRVGASDAHTSLTVVGNLAAGLENRGKDVNALMYWDAGHGADLDAEDFIAWIARITGYTRPH